MSFDPRNPKPELIRRRQKIIIEDEKGRPIREEWVILTRPAPKRKRNPPRPKIIPENPPGYVHPLIIKGFERGAARRAKHEDKPLVSTTKAKSPAVVNHQLESSADMPMLEDFFNSLARDPKAQKGQV